MKVITQRDLIKGVADKWYNSFLKTLVWRMDNKKQEIYKKLVALNKNTASAQEVDAIIGNDSWTHNRCFECGEFVPDVILMGKGDEVRAVCFSCFDKAKDMISKAILKEKLEVGK